METKISFVDPNGHGLQHAENNKELKAKTMVDGNDKYGKKNEQV